MLFLEEAMIEEFEERRWERTGIRGRGGGGGGGRGVLNGRQRDKLKYLGEKKDRRKF